MPRVEELSGVPADKVDAKIASFKIDGATAVTKTKNTDGKTFDLKATFP